MVLTELPPLGLGLWQVPAGEEAESAVTLALEAGYRHVDTAQVYGNEESVGRALSAGGVAREEVFVTTKFDPRSADPEAELERSLERLGLEHVDLYLVHWPQGGPTWAWPGMERAHARGLARSIGVSQFGARELDAVAAAASIPPAVDQVEFNPFRYRRALLNACRERGVTLEAYSPLTTGTRLGDPRVAAVAERCGRTPAQVLLRWCVQLGVPAIAKSVRRERIEENARVFDFELSDEDMSALDALDETGGTGEAIDRPLWKRVAGRVMRR